MAAVAAFVGARSRAVRSSSSERGRAELAFFCAKFFSDVLGSDLFAAFAALRCAWTALSVRAFRFAAVLQG